MENGGHKKSWSELKQVVLELRRQLSSLSTIIPSSVEFRTLKDGRTRIFFLSTPANGWETTLLYTDIVPDEPKSGRLQWHPVIESNFQSVSLGCRSSREEQLMLERRRLATWGITSYELHQASGKLVFPAASTLFQCIDTGYMNGPLFPAELRMNSSGAKLMPQICPSNPDLVAYICNSDIWVSHTLTGSTQRLTYAHKGGRTLADDPLTAGIPSYVMQEEFNRYQGYWWQPATTDGTYRILYEETDESDVKIYSFPSSNSNSSGEVEQYRFPRAGTPNSKSNLKLLTFRLSDSLQITDIHNLELQYPLSHCFPWLEYMVRVGWAPNLTNIWVQLLDRRQQRLELVLLSLDNFVEPPPNMYHTENHLSANCPPAQVISVQTTDVWINVHDLLYMFPISDCGKLTFIWASEETGYRHLYLITTNIGTYHNGVEDALHNAENSLVTNRLGSAVALTSGEWEVLGWNLWVDEERQLVYFMGLRETPLEKHLYVVSLQRPGEIRLLTRPGYSYTVDINKECNLCVVVYSNIQKLPASQVFRITHTDWTVDGVNLTPIGYILEPSVPEVEIHAPELFTHKMQSGEILYAMLFRPHGFQHGRKYPVLLNVYGGPEVQLVSNTFKGMRHLRMHMLAAQGYCVIAIDSRGSHHRGLKFESHLKGRMGTVELEDQIEVLQWLAERLQFLDMERVAIHGWSYGGYISLMALATKPHIFKVAIAGAPVTSWNLYDTGYTERYMDMPQNNLQGYKAGCVLNYINQFPDDENRLLIIHGLIDENVHFYHTSQLINAMVRAGKPYQLQVYPNERHSLRNLDASKHYETTLLSFLQNHL
ncbi:dipeptidyl peptidase 9 [Macrosteles quadrilineatus]|uniref:dipeptidyl peptidase 9 n=1 Tax=Macrosteles quadrilineatus TaxID=74068 RepID=UPI0023E3092C|nr:dipeptidyl peptidase 9 [Macrosteles quadrilineatus]